MVGSSGSSFCLNETCNIRDKNSRCKGPEVVRIWCISRAERVAGGQECEGVCDEAGEVGATSSPLPAQVKSCLLEPRLGCLQAEHLGQFPIFPVGYSLPSFQFFASLGPRNFPSVSTSLPPRGLDLGQASGNSGPASPVTSPPL